MGESSSCNAKYEITDTQRTGSPKEGTNQGLRARRRKHQLQPGDVKMPFRKGCVCAVKVRGQSAPEGTAGVTAAGLGVCEGH